MRDAKTESRTEDDRTGTASGRTWTRDDAQIVARDLGIEMTADHWIVVNYLRHLYRDDELPVESRKLAANLDAAFLDDGGMRRLYHLFPDGPIEQGCRIADVPVPIHVTKTDVDMRH